MGSKMIVRRFYEEIADKGAVSAISEVISDAYTEVMDGTRMDGDCPDGSQGRLHGRER